MHAWTATSGTAAERHLGTQILQFPELTPDVATSNEVST